MGNIHTELINDILSYASFIAFFIVLFRSDHTRKNENILLAGVCGLTGIGYLWCGCNYPVGGYRLSAVLWLAVPAIWFCCRTAAYHDGRLWFTLLSLGAIESAARVLSGAAVVLAKGGAVMGLLINCLFLLGLGLFFHKMQKEYREIMEVEEVNWTYMAVCAAWTFFIFTALGVIQIPGGGADGLFLAAVFVVTAFLWYRTLLKNVCFQGEYSYKLKLLEQLKQYEQMAYMDELTGLLNRRALDEELKRLEIRKSPFTYLVFDINDLKEVNDTYGHMLGDDFIRRAAEVLREQGREAIGVYRTGGDEFVLLFAGCGGSRERVNLEEIRAACDGFFKCGSKYYGMAVGFGEMEDYDRDSVDKVMGRSDQEMYRNKSRMKCAKTEK